MNTRKTIRITRRTRRARATRIKNHLPVGNTSTGDVAAIARERKIPSFAVVLEGNTLAPRYCDGDLLVIDTEATPAVGGAVLIAFPPGGETARVMILNADRDVTDLRGGYLSQGRFEILGAVIDVHPRRS